MHNCFSLVCEKSNNKGYLDPEEKKMRELDTSNRGYLTNSKVYNMFGLSVISKKYDV